MDNDNNENNPNDININESGLNVIGRGLFRSPTTFDNIMINELTNMLTNRVINNNNNFFSFNSQNIAPQNNIINILQNSLYEKNKYKKVISEKGLTELKTIIFKDNEQDIKDCAITQEKFKENQEITQLPCKHIFETEAIWTWLKEESNSCPICRFELDFKEICEKCDDDTINESTNDSVNEEVHNEVVTDSDDEMPELEETEQERQNIIQQRERILSNLNSIIRNIQIIDHAEPRRLRRQQAFEYIDNDLQEALMASIEEQKNENFLTHPDTQHDLNFNEILSDSDSDLDDDLNSVD